VSPLSGLVPTELLDANCSTLGVGGVLVVVRV
jgi:hypothetical protein